MRYERDYQELFGGMQGFVRPTLPTIEFKDQKTRITYSIPDFRILDQVSVKTFEGLMSHAIYGELEGVTLAIPEGFDNSNNDIERAIDIVSSFTITAKKGGKKGFYFMTALLVSSVDEEKDTEGNYKSVRFNFIKEQAKTIHKFAKEITEEGGGVNLVELVRLLVEEHQRNIEVVPYEEIKQTEEIQIPIFTQKEQ